MKNLIYTFLLILTFFSGCGSSNTQLFPKQNFTENEKPLWDKFILSPSDFPKNLAIKHDLKEPLIGGFFENNPGFIDLDKFSTKFSKHPLTKLNRWYQGLFYHTDYTLHYMVLMFPKIKDAKEYLPHLREQANKAKKIYRINRHLIIFDLRDNDNQSMDYDPAHPMQSWIKKRMQTISE